MSTHSSLITDTITSRHIGYTYKAILSKIGEDTDRQRMSGTIVGMNCHPHLPTRSFPTHPIKVNTVSSNNLRKEQPYMVFNSKVYNDVYNGINSSVDVSSSLMTDDLNKKKKKTPRKSRWFNGNRSKLNLEKNAIRTTVIQKIRLDKSLLRINETKARLKKAQTKLDLIDSASAKTKGTIRHSHRLVECLDEFELAKREFDSSQVYHKKASLTRYRDPRKQSNRNNAKSPGLSLSGINSTYNSRKRPNKKYVNYKDDSEDECTMDYYDPTYNIKDYKEDESDVEETTQMYKGKKSIDDRQVLDILNKWVYELKAMDNDNMPFFSKCLVILRGNHKLWENKTWNQIDNLSNDTIKSTIKEVIFVQRNNTGQMYMVQGLQSSLHFSLGSHGTQRLKSLCKRAGICLWKGSNTKQITPFISSQQKVYFTKGLYVKSVKHSHMSSFELGYYTLMEKAASGLWTTLFRVSLYFIY